MDNLPQAGFMVPKKFLTDIRSVPPQMAIVRPRAAVIGADGSSPDAAVGIPVLDQTGASQPASNFAGASGSWIAEGALKPQTDIALREMELVPKEFAGHMIVTDKLLRNWSGADELIRRVMRDVMIAAEDTAFITGTGVGQPLGITNSSAAYSQSRAGPNAVVTADVENMLSRFLIRGGTRDNAVWSFSQSVLPQLMLLKDANNNNIWLPNLITGYPGTLLGIPAMINNRQPALGTKGDIILADWSYYIIKDGSGPFIATSEHVYFTSNKTVIKFFFLVDGAPWLSTTFKEENGYEVSPFVLLAA
jgi:HK97 family phage major capsid protein